MKKKIAIGFIAIALVAIGMIMGALMTIYSANLVSVDENGYSISYFDGMRVDEYGFQA